MKTIIIFLFACFSLTGAEAQSFDHQPDRNTISEITHLKNGKYAFSRHMATGFDGKWNTGNEDHWQMKSVLPNPKRLSDGPLQTHHISFHFDDWIDIVMLNSADTAFYDSYNLFWNSNHTILEGDIPDGYYYFFCLMQGLGQTSLLYPLMEKNFHIYKDIDTTISTSSGIHSVNLLANDENGNPVINHCKFGDSWTCILEFPDAMKYPYTSVGFCGSVYITGIMMSDFPPEVKITWGKTDVTTELPYKEYVLTYPVLAGINRDTTLTINASDYLYTPVYFHSSPAATESIFGFGSGTILNDSLMGYAHYFVPVFITPSDYPGRLADTIKIFTAGATCATNKLLDATRIVHEENFDKSYDISSPVMYMTPAYKLDLTCGYNYPTVAGDYLLSNGNSVAMGSSTPFNMSQSYTVPNSNFIQIYPQFKGQANERRDVDRSFATYDVWKWDDHIYHDSLLDGIVTYGTSDNSVYTVVINDSNYVFFGQQGYLQSKLIFDLGNNDPNAPTLIALKVLQGDSLRTEIINGFEASVKFTAGDYSYTLPQNLPHYHSLANVQLEFKGFTDTTWQTLPVTIDLQSFDSLSGMQYIADLSPAMNQIPDSSLVDLRVTLVDLAGNLAIQTLHPAFFMRNALVGYGRKTMINSVLLFPNPASETLHIGAVDDQITTWVYTSTGQLVLQVAGSRELDISGLQAGFYLVKVKDQINGNYSIGKFIR